MILQLGTYAIWLIAPTYVFKGRYGQRSDAKPIPKPIVYGNACVNVHSESPTPLLLKKRVRMRLDGENY